MNNKRSKIHSRAEMIIRRVLPLLVLALAFVLTGCDDYTGSEKDENGIYTYVPGQIYSHGDAVRFPDGTIHYWDDNSSAGVTDSDPTGQHFVDKPPAPKSPASPKSNVTTSSVPKASPPPPSPSPSPAATEPPAPPYVPAPPAPVSDPVTVVAAGSTTTAAPEVGECVISADYSQEGLSLEPSMNVADRSKWWYSLSEVWQQLTDTIMLAFSPHPGTVVIQDGDCVKIGYGEGSTVALKETITVNNATPHADVQPSGAVELTKEDDAQGSQDYLVSGSDAVISTVDDPETMIPENETELVPPKTLTPDSGVIVTDSGSSTQVDVYDEIVIPARG